MSVPGFSVSDLIDAVNWTIGFIKALESARKEIKDLEKRLETARSELTGLESLLQKRRELVGGPIQFRTAELRVLRNDLHEIVNDIFNLLSRFDPKSKSGSFAGFKTNLRWVVDNRYSGSVEALLSRLSEYKQNVHTELLLWLSYNELEKKSQREHVSGDVTAAVEKEINAIPPAIHAPVAKPALLPVQNQPGPWPPGHVPPSPPLTPPAIDYPNPVHTTSSATPPTQKPQTLNLQQNNPRELLPDILQIVGNIKVWFQYEDVKGPYNISYPIKSIAILRDHRGNFRGIRSTRPDGAVLEHELPNDTFFLKSLSHPLPVHRRQARDLIEGQFQASNCITFLRGHENTTSMIPDYYSFSGVEDYRLFQNKIVGGYLIAWYEVKSISSNWSPTPLCENQILQLWNVGGVRKIHFFRNGKDRQYSQHCVSSLRDSKRSLKTAQEKGLKLRFERTNGSPALSTEEQQMGHLLIIFTNQNEIITFLNEANFA